MLSSELFREKEKRVTKTLIVGTYDPLRLVYGFIYIIRAAIHFSPFFPSFLGTDSVVGSLFVSETDSEPQEFVNSVANAFDR